MISIYSNTSIEIEPVMDFSVYKIIWLYWNGMLCVLISVYKVITFY